MFIVTKATASPPATRSAVRERADATYSHNAALSTADANDAEPSLSWFDERRYYAGRALPFFSSVSNAGGSVVQKRLAPWYPAVEAVALSSPNLRTIHASLLPLATPDGGLLLSAFVDKFLATLVPPHTDLSYVRRWFRRIGIPVVVEQAAPLNGSAIVPPPPQAGARAASPSNPLPKASKGAHQGTAAAAAKVGSVDDETSQLVLPYLDVIRALDNLFNRSNGQSTKWAFALCDLGETGFILKGTLQHLSTRDASLDAFVPSEPVLAQRPVPEPKKPVGLGPTRVETTLAVEPPADLTYPIVRAILQCFEQIAAQEVETAMAAMKKGKKGKKNAVPVLPSKRQFHINLAEFSAILAVNPYVACAFVPFIIKRAVEEGDAAVKTATAPSPVPSDATSRRPPTAAPSDDISGPSAAPSRIGAATPSNLPPPANTPSALNSAAPAAAAASLTTSGVEGSAGAAQHTDG